MSKKSQNKPVMPFGGDLSQIMASANQIAQSITSEDRGKMNNMDMNQMFEHVTNTVFSSLEKGGQQIDPASKQQMKMMSKVMLGQVMESMEPETNHNIKSKIDLPVPSNLHVPPGSPVLPILPILSQTKEDKIPEKENIFEDLDTDEEADELYPCVDSLHYNLPVTLEELYTGKIKKLAVTRDRLDKTGRKVENEKRKIEIPVMPGMKDGQEIRFNKQGNEKPGYASGDIVITLATNAHSNFERIGDILTCVKNISLYESYAAGRGDINVVIKHLDGSYMILKTDGNPLHTKDGARKIRNGGMPIYNKKSNKTEYGDLYIRFNVILPENFEGDEQLVLIEKLFPVLPINKDSIVYKNPKKHSDFDIGSNKVREVFLEEVTPEDMEQLEFDEEEESEESSEDQSGSE
jgi:DnaJ-class molecular chaperone